MTNIIKRLCKSFFTREFLVYLFFGILTTVVNFAVFGWMKDILGDDLTLLSNAIAFVVSVIFAFLTNKPFVFASKSWKLPVVIKEFAAFIGSRLATFGLEETGLFVCQYILYMGETKILGIDGLNFAKWTLSLAIAILNYVLSIFFVFKKRPE